MKRNRKTIVAYLLIFSLVLTSGSFAYWASYVEGTTSEAVETLTIGSAEGVDTEFVLSNNFDHGGLLVPTDQLLNSTSGSVDTVYLSYDLKWQEAEDVSQLEGTITKGDIVVTHKVIITQDGQVLNRNQYSQIYNLVNVFYYLDNPTEMELDADHETFNFDITLDEPDTLHDYNLISNADIKIVFSFNIFDSSVSTKDIESDTSPFPAPQPSTPTSEIILNGDEVVYVEAGGEYEEQGMVAYDSNGDEIDNTWIEGGINTWKLGEQTLTYHAYSEVDNDYVEVQTRTIVVIDTTAPIIYILGQNPVYVDEGASYYDWFAWAYDHFDGYIRVSIENNVDIEEEGTYYIKYTAVDQSGNESIAYRTVIVQDD